MVEGLAESLRELVDQAVAILETTSVDIERLSVDRAHACYAQWLAARPNRGKGRFSTSLLIRLVHLVGPRLDGHRLRPSQRNSLADAPAGTRVRVGE